MVVILVAVAVMAEVLGVVQVLSQPILLTATSAEEEAEEAEGASYYPV